MSGGDLLDAAVAELYAADPDEFTQRRAELAGQAKSAGQAPVAKQITALRKPTRSAWAINQLTRSDPDAADQLAGLGERLRAAEEQRDGDQMRELAKQRRTLIAALVKQVLAASGQPSAAAGMREEITATLAAALADPEVAAEIQRGTLLRPARRPGFGLAGGPLLTVVPEASPRPAAKPKPGRRPTAGKASPSGAPAKAAAQAQAAEEARERAKAEAKARAEEEAQARAAAEAEARAQARAEAEERLADAEQAADQASQAKQDLEEEIRELEEQLNEARQRLHDARGQVRQADAVQRRARQALSRLPD